MVLIILPVKNESKTITSTIKLLLNWCIKNLNQQFKILFIDDGSTDNTFKIIKQNKNKNISVLKNSFDQGKGSALKAGFILSNHVYSMDKNDLIVFMDGDGQIEPAEIKTFLNLMDLYSADVVIGNKRHTYSSICYSPIRKIVSSGYNFLIRLLFGFNYQDTQCGIKVFKKYALDQVIHKITVKRFAFDLELIVALREMKLRVADAPVKIKEQVNAGAVTFINIFQTFLDTIKIYRKLKKGFYAYA